MNKFILHLLTVLLFSASAQARKLSDFAPYDYQVLFTNPVCKEYRYKEPIPSRSGGLLQGKPKNAFCKSSDAEASANQEGAPMRQMLSWIEDASTTEIFMTFLTFSNKVVSDSLCRNIRERDLKLTLVIDQESDAATAEGIIKNCKAEDPERNPVLHRRGHVSGIGYAHNKLVIINPSSKKQIRVAFGSGNMTSGIVLHHENWHFITTSPKTYFAASHLCVIEAELEHADSGKSFRDFMKSCLAEIEGEPEEDIQPHFVPGQGKAAMQSILATLTDSTSVDIAAHRFSNSELIAGLLARLDQSDTFQLRLVFDDDMFWVGEGLAFNRPNMKFEYGHVKRLVESGAEPRYMETNHSQHLLHHNKFLVFRKNERPFAAFVGAGNLTGDAFSKNMENFYFVTIPEVVRKLGEQYEHLYDELATAPQDLPEKDVVP